MKNRDTQDREGSDGHICRNHPETCNDPRCNH